MSTKPEKYGMKFFLLCDCLTGYAFNGKAYLGGQGNQRNIGLANDVVKTLFRPLNLFKINITTNNWFTSSQLAADLLQKQITLLGTIRKKRRNFHVNSQRKKEEASDQVCLNLMTGKL